MMEYKSYARYTNVTHDDVVCDNEQSVTDVITDVSESTFSAEGITSLVSPSLLKLNGTSLYLDQSAVFTDSSAVTTFYYIFMFVIFLARNAYKL